MDQSKWPHKLANRIKHKKSLYVSCIQMGCRKLGWLKIARMSTIQSIATSIQTFPLSAGRRNEHTWIQ
jgi:hypothetical protein